MRQDVKRAYYYVRITVPVITATGRCSRRIARKLAFVDEVSKKEVMRLRAQVLELVNEGRMLVQSQLRFKDVAQRFLDVRVPQLGFATQNKYRTQIKNHILPAFGELRLCDIDRPGVEEWLTAKATELGWWSRTDLKGVLSAIYTAARNWKLWSGDNPTEGVRVGRKMLVREKRLLTVEQMRLILAALSDRERFLVLILLGTGIRISEALGMRWADIDFAQGTLEIRRRWYRGDLSDEGCTKTESSTRRIQLGPLVSEFAQRNPGPQAKDHFVFIGDDGVLPPDDRDLLRFEFRPILKRLKLYYPGFGWHAFRRQNVTWRQSVGNATPFEAQKAAGHGSPEMTFLYTLTDREREKGQVQAIFDHLMGRHEGKPQ